MDVCPFCIRSFLWIGQDRQEWSTYAEGSRSFAPLSVLDRRACVGFLSDTAERDTFRKPRAKGPLRGWEDRDGLSEQQEVCDMTFLQKDKLSCVYRLFFESGDVGNVDAQLVASVGAEQVRSEFLNRCQKIGSVPERHRSLIYGMT